MGINVCIMRGCGSILFSQLYLCLIFKARLSTIVRGLGEQHNNSAACCFVSVFIIFLMQCLILHSKVRKEIERCYELIHRLGRGVIYVGSARPGSDHPHYKQAVELSREAGTLTFFMVFVTNT